MLKPNRIDRLNSLDIVCSMKEYDAWNEQKKRIEDKVLVPNFSEQDIWWASLGLNVGFEEDGKNESFERPVCVLKKFNKDIFFGLPLTSTQKDGAYYFPHALHDTEGSIILSQGRLMSAKRLRRKLGRMGRGKFKALRKKYTELF